jgi:arylsulfatase A-like enzyme
MKTDQLFPVVHRSFSTLNPILLALSIFLATDLHAATPNIILIMPDDMGYPEIAAHGNPLLQTPHLDKLRSESLRFTDFHVSPTCAPTRSALLTGRHEFKNGVTHTVNERERLTLQATTLAQILRQAGYASGIFGKWHLGDEPDRWPNQRGFDEMFIHGAGGIGQTYDGSCGDAPDNKYFDPAILHNGAFVKTKGYCTDIFFTQATQWIDARRQSGQPFFAYITPNAPHDPLVSPGPKYDALYRGKEINGKKLNEGDVVYYAMISNIDDNVGKLLAKLKDWRLENDTLVIFLTDNGSTHARLFGAGMRGGKATAYQGGHRVPSFWRWPAMFKGGVDCAALAAHIDVLPTLAEITGIPLTNDLAQQVEGRSLMPLLRDPKSNWPNRTLVTHVGRWPRGEVAQWKHRNSAIRDSRFSLVNDNELYDLRNDFAEATNVIEKFPEVVSRLRREYDQWWIEVQPLLVNEQAIGPKMNPFKALYWKQFGGGPDEALLPKVNPSAVKEPKVPGAKQTQAGAKP